jgi:hypothetical protein
VISKKKGGNKRKKNGIVMKLSIAGILTNIAWFFMRLAWCRTKTPKDDEPQTQEVYKYLHGPNAA